MDNSLNSLKNAIVKTYGERSKDKTDIIIDRLNMVIAACLFAGSQGDNPLCQLNRFFEEVYKK